MRNRYSVIPICGLVGLALMIETGCSRPASSGIKKVEAGKEFSGFLKDYTNLKPNAKLGGNILTYVNQEQAKHLRRYVAVLVDPVEVYLASDADPTKFQTKAGEALSRYFERALKKSIGDAFTIVDSPGPLVLRLRAAIVGVGVGAGPADKSDVPSESLNHSVKISNVQIELELVDSETGERIAAAVDKESLGTDAEVGAFRFERVEKYLAAKEAFDEWAGRVREFLDAEHEVTGDDAKRVVESYAPYGQEPTKQ